MEDFRHTPLVPISDRDLREHQQKIEQRNRKGYYVEIRKDTLYFYSIALLALGTTFYAFLMANEKQMRIKQDLQRTKTLRQKANSGRKGASILLDRQQADTERKKAIY